MNETATGLAAPRIQPGQGGLEIELVSGQSAVTSSWAGSPLKILVPRPRGQSVWAYMSSYGGGLLAGDEIKVDLKLADQTRCFLSTQASTKVYRNPQQRPCGHHLTANLGADALLALVPDPVQSFATSRYTQYQEFFMPASAGVVLVDWFCSGRVARGERWAFTHFRSRNEVTVDGRRVLVDSVLLDPTDGALAQQHRMGRFNCVAFVALIGAPVRAAAAASLAIVAEQSVPRGGSLVVSASPIRHGALLRFAGESAEQVGQTLHQHLKFLEAMLGDDPLARKW